MRHRETKIVADCAISSLGVDVPRCSTRPSAGPFLGSLDTVTSTPSNNYSMTLVRHGETNWNDQRLIQGHNNVAQLTARGREQAREAAESFRGLGFELLVASDLDRARETAQIIGDALGLSVLSEPLLRERSFGTFEGGPQEDLTSAVTGIENDVIVDPDARPPEGESFRDVVNRSQRFFERVIKEWSEQRLLIVTHGGTIRALRAYALRTPLEGLSWYEVGNCSVWPLSNDLVTG
jgi:broad specificity phosphatase PhoE